MNPFYCKYCKRHKHCDWYGWACTRRLPGVNFEGYKHLTERADTIVIKRGNGNWICAPEPNLRGLIRRSFGFPIEKSEENDA